MKNNKKIVDSFITYAIVIIAYVAISILIKTNNLTNLMKGLLIPVCSYIIAALSLNLTVGVLGELSLGQGGFMSVGAFGAMLMNSILLASPLPVFVRIIISIVFGSICAAFFGFVVGMPVLRLQGDYLAIVTLAFGEIIKALLTNLYVGFDTNGIHINFVKNNIELAAGGSMIINGPMGVSNTKCATFTLGFILIMLTLVVIFNLVNSKTGRAIMAFRDNKIAAESVGINVSSYKLMTFVISAFMAGVAGSLFGLNSSTLVASKFDYNTSILILVFVVLGGLGNMRGSIIAASLLTVLPELMRSLKDYRMLIYAILLITIMIVTNNPTINNFTNQILSKLKLKKGKEEVAANE